MTPAKVVLRLVPLFLLTLSGSTYDDWQGAVSPFDGDWDQGIFWQGASDSPYEQLQLEEAVARSRSPRSRSDDTGELNVRLEMARDGGAVTVTIPDALCDSTDNVYTPAPLDLFCVIDTSASMCAMAHLEEDNEAELTVMDLTKQCVRHLASCLGPQDTLSLVTFSERADIKLSKTRMDATGQARALRNIDMIEEGGPTNLFDGIQFGLRQFGRSDMSGDSAGRHGHIIVLTDGQPTSGKTLFKDIVEGVEELQDTYKTPISLYGFKRKHDSAILCEIAERTGGSYNYIDGPGFMGTAMIHAVSNIRASAARKVSVDVELVPLRGNRGIPEFVAEGAGDQPTTNTKSYQLGANHQYIAYGQAHSALLPAVTQPCTLKVTVRVERISGIHQAFIVDRRSLVVTRDMLAAEPSALLLAERRRADLVNTLRAATDVDHSTALVLLNNLETQIREDLASDVVKQSSDSIADEECMVEEYLRSISGADFEQFKLAVDRAHYPSWGQHYLRAMRIAHDRMACHNFKDEGVQTYGGDVFNQIRETADDTFNGMMAPRRHISRFQRDYCLTGNKHTDQDATGCNIDDRARRENLMKMPNGSYQARTFGGYSQPARQPVPRAASPPRSMAAYNNANYGGCFSGDSLVRVRDAQGVVREIQVRDLHKGDQVLVAGVQNNGGLCFSAVECVVHTVHREGEEQPMWRVGDVDLTEWHPVRVDGAWVFPGKAGTPAAPASEVYNLVLEGREPAVIGGVEVSTLGHNDRSSEVIAHDYFGTDEVIRDLSGLAGWTKGRVELEPGCFARDAASGRVCAMRKASKL